MTPSQAKRVAAARKALAELAAGYFYDGPGNKFQLTPLLKARREALIDAELEAALMDSTEQNAVGHSEGTLDSGLPDAPAAPVADHIVWGEPRRMWDGTWYRVGTSTAATVADVTQMIHDAGGDMKKVSERLAAAPAPAAPALLTEGEIEDWFASETSTLHPSDDFEGPRLKLITSLRDMAQAYRRSQQGDFVMVLREPTANMRKAAIAAMASAGGHKFIAAWEAAIAAHKDTK